MRQYQQLLCDVLNLGVDRSDRTGTGTRSLFGYQMRFELAAGFPLLTTKKMFTKGMVDELLWFLSGSTNVNDLNARSQHWWTPWQRSDGGLGPIYGEQYRKSRWFYTVDPVIFDPPEVTYEEGKVFGVGIMDTDARLGKVGNSDADAVLKTTWREMLRRCYCKTDKSSYASYGAKGYHVCDRWLTYSNFAEDAVKLINWEMKAEYPGFYSLDKDILKASNRYGPDTCMWASYEEQGWNTSTGAPFSATKDGVELIFPSIGEMVREYGVAPSAVHRCLKGGLKTHHGWSDFRYLDSATTFRFREVDQLKLAVATAKHNPQSRRNIINLWHTPAMQHAELPCCHGSVIQLYVANGELSLHLYQRSVDSFIGLPVNIASYALLTMMLAQVTGLKPGTLVWTGGDVHLYHNHFDQAKLQVTHQPFDLPKMVIKNRGQAIDQFEYSDFELVGYEAHPHIKAEVAV